MKKPLFRWTVGSCIQQGLDILKESIQVTTSALGLDNWDWVICHNGLTQENLEFLRDAIGDKPIELLAQNWADCPIPDTEWSPIKSDGTIEYNGNYCGGTLWKVCPGRLRVDSHEIIMDNDILLLKKFPQIDEFLNSKKTLILEEPIRFYGRYDGLFGSEPYLNSGFMGMPPGYDFAKEIKNSWQQHGSYRNLTQADEQGLLVYTLNKQSNLRVHKHQMIECLHRDYKVKVTGFDQAYHFTQANRMPNHRSWNEYNNLKGHVFY